MSVSFFFLMKLSILQLILVCRWMTMGGYVRKLAFNNTGKKNSLPMETVFYYLPTNVATSHRASDKCSIQLSKQTAKCALGIAISCVFVFLVSSAAYGD